MSSKLRIISRESPLAMWQACHVRDNLSHYYPDIDFQIIGVTTEADKFLEQSLESLGGKGAFVKELEQALLAGSADLAVHSMKDVTVDLPEGLVLSVIMSREDPRDVLVSNIYERLEDLPENARVGTSSLRRLCQLQAIRPDLEFVSIRGNVGTRLNKLDDGQYDALILAAAGIKRLGLQERITQYLEVDALLPAVGQGAMGIELREQDPETYQLVKQLNDEKTFTCVIAERAFSRRLNGGCHAPIAAYAEIDGTDLHMNALVGRLDGSEIIRSSITGTSSEAEVLGSKLGQELLDAGADVILQDVMNHSGK